MAKSRKGICANCKREQTLVAGGHCYLCYNSSRYLAGEDREEGLKRARERVAAGNLRGKRLSPAPAREPSLGARQVAEKIIEKVEPLIEEKPQEKKQPAPAGRDGGQCPPYNITRKPVTMSLTFAGNDVRLYEALVARGRRERRDPEQQLMFILDHQLLEVHRGQEEG